MRLFARIVVSALVFLTVYFFSYWMVFAQLFGESQDYAPTAAAFLAAAAAAFWIWRTMAADEHGIFATVAYWAAIGGTVGFCGGFFGPLIFAPGANQGPLLGLLITGPLGFVGGGLAGLIYTFWHRLKGNAFS